VRFTNAPSVTAPAATLQAVYTATGSHSESSPPPSMIAIHGVATPAIRLILLQNPNPVARAVVGYT
jgi:hypothetical protein